MYHTQFMGYWLKLYIHLRPWRPFWIYANYNFPQSFHSGNQAKYFLQTHECMKPSKTYTSHDNKVLNLATGL